MWTDFMCIWIGTSGELL